MTAAASERQDDRLSEEFSNLSFAGCGFLGIYHVGVASCFKEYAPHLYAERISGASAGALVACALVTGCCLGECTTFTLKLALQARKRALGPLSPSFELVKNLRKALWTFLPENAHEIATGRLFVSLTRLSDKQNVLVSQFSDKNDLIDALICSSFVPLYCGLWPPKYRGVRYVDGALSINNPILDRNTITVSPFAGESDICPDDQSCNLHHINLAGTSIQLTSRNLYRASVAFFPPSPEVLSNMCRQGFDDALRFLKKNRLISCTQHLSIKSVISSSPLEFDLFDPASSEQEEQADDSKCSIVLSTESSSTDDDDDDSSGCEECEERERIALRDSPPLLVQTALQAACDEVNNGFLAKVYKSRVYHVLSLMATPYVLPFEVAYQLVRKLYDWAPYMPEDMQWFIRGLYNLSLELLSSSCESVVKGQSGWHLNHLAVTMGVYFGVKVKHVRHRKPSAHRKHSACRESSVRPYLLGSSRQTSEEQDLPLQTVLPKSSSNDAENAEQQMLNVNFGIKVKYVHSPLRCARSARGQILEHQHASIRNESSSSEVMNTEEELEHEAIGQEPQTAVPAISNVSERYAYNENYDSFDDCLHIANQMDSILSYYYLQEGDPTKVKVIEIFPRRH